jgi:hypothetical protein
MPFKGSGVVYGPGTSGTYASATIRIHVEVVLSSMDTGPFAKEASKYSFPDLYITGSIIACMRFRIHYSMHAIPYPV